MYVAKKNNNNLKLGDINMHLNKKRKRKKTTIKQINKKDITK